VIKSRPKGRRSALRPIVLVAAVGVAIGSVLAAAVVTTVSLAEAPHVAVTDTVTTASAPLDPEVLLPSRVDARIQRTMASVDRAAAFFDDARLNKARRTLKAVAANFKRSQRAAMVQLNLPIDEESESTMPIDGVLAVLNVDQGAITEVAALFHGQKRTAQIAAALRTGLNRRAAVLKAVLALPEERGAPYIEGLAELLDLYGDEVANIEEALAHDRLTPAARSALQSALAKSKAANSAVVAAVGPQD
jgi:hypothetical protein